MKRRNFLKLALGLFVLPTMVQAGLGDVKESKDIVSKLDELLKPPCKIVGIYMSPEKVRELKVACRKFPDYPHGSRWSTRLPTGELCSAYKSTPFQAQQSLSGSEVMICPHQFSATGSF